MLVENAGALGVRKVVCDSDFQMVRLGLFTTCVMTLDLSQRNIAAAYVRASVYPQSWGSALLRARLTVAQ